MQHVEAMRPKGLLPKSRMQGRSGFAVPFAGRKTTLCGQIRTKCTTRIVHFVRIWPGCGMFRLPPKHAAAFSQVRRSGEFFSAPTFRSSPYISSISGQKGRRFSRALRMRANLLDVGLIRWACG